MRKKIGSGIRYGVRNCARRCCECICSPALKQARVKGAINLTPVFPLFRSPSFPFDSVFRKEQLPSSKSLFTPPIQNTRSKSKTIRFIPSFFLFYFTCLARLREQISIVYREHFCHALYVEHINNDGTTPQHPVLSLLLSFLFFSFSSFYHFVSFIFSKRSIFDNF